MGDIIERFRYRFELWRRERREDLFGVPRTDDDSTETGRRIWEQISVVRLLVDVVFCLCGIAILAFAIYLWSGFGFSPGPNHHLHPGAPDPSFHARWLVFVGLGISGYFGFSLASTFVQTDSKDEDNGPGNI